MCCCGYASEKVANFFRLCKQVFISLFCCCCMKLPMQTFGNGLEHKTTSRLSWDRFMMDGGGGGGGATGSGIPDLPYFESVPARLWRWTTNVWVYVITLGNNVHIFTNRSTRSRRDSNGFMGFMRSSERLNGSFLYRVAMTKGKGNAQLLITRAANQTNTGIGDFMYVRLLSPLVLWMFLVIALRTVVFVRIFEMYSPVTILDIINAVQARNLRVAFLTLNVASSNNTDTKEFYRSALLSEQLLLLREWTAALYGRRFYTRFESESAYPFESVNMLNPPAGFLDIRNSSFHVDLKGGGLLDAAFSGGTYGSRLHNILFGTNGLSCFLANETACYATEHPYYPIVAGGLVSMMTYVMEELSQIQITPIQNINLTTPSVDFLLSDCIGNIEGAILDVLDAHTGYVHSLYNNVEAIAIVLLTLTLMTAFVFYVACVQPYIRRNKAEFTAVARMLVQLPPNINLEAIVKQQLLGYKALENLR